MQADILTGLKTRSPSEHLKNSFEVEFWDFSLKWHLSVSLFHVFLGGLDSKAPACNAGDLGSIPRLGRSPGEGNGNPLQYSCLENPMDEGAW